MPTWVAIALLCVGIGGMLAMPWARRFDAKSGEGRSAAGTKSRQLPDWIAAVVAVALILAGAAVSAIP
jgi:uncharacterized SAM-binding protein YcdF (DUF218 family)